MDVDGTEIVCLKSVFAMTSSCGKRPPGLRFVETGQVGIMLAAPRCSQKQLNGDEQHKRLTAY